MMNDKRKVLQTGLLLACRNEGATPDRGNIRTAMNTPGGMAPANAPGKAAKTNDNPETFQYYYHSDHLGSTSLITNLDGEVVQHVEYLPFGEVFLEERNNRWNTPFLFNAKELDGETGLYYYGTRYYDPRTSVWLSTDPLQEKYPNISTYAYCGNNPINFIDPDGNAPIPAYYMNDRGFWSDGYQGFGTYVGNVRPNTGSYYELTRINGTLYHKNLGNAGRSIVNKVFGTNMVEKKPYSVEEETWNDGILMMGEGAALSLGLKVVGGLAGALLKQASGSLWKIAPFQRGFVFESMTGVKGLFSTNGLKNYPIIDAFYNGVATSIKTLELTAKSYLKGNAVFNKLAGYVDDLAGFNGTNFGGINTTNQITSKVLEVGIPRGATSAQVGQINQAIEYATSKGIQMNIRVVE